MQVNTLILGAGAAGLMAAAFAGPDTLVIDHAKAPGEKIRISGGGRCNFTNLHTSPENFICANPHFAKSALGRYTQWDFIALVERYGIAWHEKTLGQLFCDRSAKDIIAMLLAEMKETGARLWLQTDIGDIAKDADGFVVNVTRDGHETAIRCTNLVVATGGKSIPKMGATGRAYAIAAQFGLRLVDPQPALVPLTFADNPFAGMSGTAVPVRAYAGATSFEEAALFTHRGLSGPAILQASSYWTKGEAVTLDLAPEGGLLERLKADRQAEGKKAVTTILGRYLPARLAAYLTDLHGLTGPIADMSDAALRQFCDAVTNWDLTPDGSEGYRTAEVTRGGIDTDDLSSKTLEAKAVSGLYFIGEAVDVTGWLGGYNFQWAWSSGWAAGTAIAAKTKPAVAPA